MSDHKSAPLTFPYIQAKMAAFTAAAPALSSKAFFAKSSVKARAVAKAPSEPSATPAASPATACAHPRDPTASASATASSRESVEAAPAGRGAGVARRDSEVLAGALTGFGLKSAHISPFRPTMGLPGHLYGVLRAQWGAASLVSM